MFKDSVFDKYRNDPAFKQVVDMMEALIHHAQLTPLEVRQAAMCAAIRFQERQLPGPIYITREDFDKWFKPDIEARRETPLQCSELQDPTSWEIRPRRG